MNAMTVESPVRPDPVPEVRGGVRVEGRVIQKVAREASAAAIGVPRTEVNVEVSEWGGDLGVRIAAKLPIPDLDDTEAVRAATPVLQRVREVQSALAGELARLTGREIRRISLTVTGAIVPVRRRVR